VSPVRTARIALLALMAVLLLFLLLGAKPWHLPGGPGFFAHEDEPLHVVVARALWWSAAFGAALCAGLAATARLWAAPRPTRGAAAPSPPRWLLPLLLAAVLLGGALRAELALGGLWWDEAWLVRRIVVGEFRPEPSLDGPAPRFVAAPWIRTLFDYRKPTNHLPQSAASRLSVDAWRAATGAPPEAFDELALRLPSLLAALATIALLGLLVADWGFPRAGAAAAFALALHPWHIELGSGARGFAFVGFAAAAGALALGRALRSGAWRWWLAYAASQALLLWVHPFAVYLTACLGAAALAALLLGGRARCVPRLVAVHALVALAVVLAMGPAIAQAPLWQEVHRARPDDRRSPVRLAGKVARELWINASVGMTRQLPQTDPARRYPSLAELRGAQPLLRPVVGYALPALALLGLAAALRGPGPRRAVVLGLVLAPCLALAASAALGHLGRRFHPRYLFFVLALVPPVLAIGVEAGAARLAGRRRGAAAAGLALAAAVVGFAWLVRAPLANLASHPYSGMREAVAFVAARPDAAGALRAGFGLGGDTARAYDPSLLHAESAEELRALAARARADGRPLYVIYGYRGQNLDRAPEAIALLEDRERFEPLGRFEAVAPEFVYRAVRYTGTPLD
jgi:hypothetical protein